MKKLLPYLTIFSILILAFLLWKKASTPAHVLKQPIILEKKIELAKSIEKINKKIPEKLFKKIKIKTKEEQVIQFNKPKSFQEILPEDEIATHIQDANGNLIITSVTIVDDLIIAHGDLIVGRIDNMEDFLERTKTGRPIMMAPPRLWEDGVIPFEIEDGLENSNEVNEAIEEINSTTNIKWVPRSNQKDFVQFKKGPLNCYSPLGKIGGKQNISLSSNCTSGSIMHEMLHTMGLLHEQNREDRDKYIRILWENIDAKNHLQFQKISNKLLDLKKHPFDFKSLMLYEQGAFSKYSEDFTIVRIDGDTYMANKSILSSGDLKKLSSLYPK